MRRGTGMTRGPFSYSRIATFKKCPAKYNWSYIDKIDVPFIPSPAMERGSRIHDSLEQFMNKHTDMLDPEIHEHYGQFFFSIRENYTVQPEAKWAFNWQWEPCDYDDPNCMVRGFMDLKFVPEEENIQVYEYKTGKQYVDEHRHQMLLYGVAALLQHPQKEGVDVTAVYLDLKKNDKIYYPASMMFEYKPAFKREFREIEDCEEFIPKPQFSCRWCQFSKNNGGPCQF